MMEKSRLERVAAVLDWLVASKMVPGVMIEMTLFLKSSGTAMRPRISPTALREALPPCRLSTVQFGGEVLPSSIMKTPSGRLAGPLMPIGDWPI